MEFRKSVPPLLKYNRTGAIEFDCNCSNHKYWSENDDSHRSKNNIECAFHPLRRRDENLGWLSPAIARPFLDTESRPRTDRKVSSEKKSTMEFNLN